MARPKTTTIHDKKRLVSARIRGIDSVKLMNYPERNVSKVVRDIFSWCLEEPSRAQRIFKEGEPIKTVIDSVSREEIESLLRRTVKEELIEFKKELIDKLTEN